MLCSEHASKHCALTLEANAAKIARNWPIYRGILFLILPPLTLCIPDQ